MCQKYNNRLVFSIDCARWTISRYWRWHRKLGLFYKIYKNKSPSYLSNLILERVKFCSSQSSQINNISNLKTRSNFLIFWNLFFPFWIIEWNTLGRDSTNGHSLNIFKLQLLKFITLAENRIFDINNLYGLKFLTRQDRVTCEIINVYLIFRTVLT